jgi:hypothetical protein
VYLGAQPLVEALGKGAQIVVGGRLTDTGLTLAPLMHEFGWSFLIGTKSPPERLPGILSNAARSLRAATCQYDWANIPDLANVGFPIVEAFPNGEFVVTKHENTGGIVSVPSIKEQLLYEMGDPHAYITPDVVADFTTINLSADSENRVKVYGIEGKPNTDFYKVSIAYSAGWKAVGRSCILILKHTKKRKPPIRFYARASKSSA